MLFSIKRNKIQGICAKEKNFLKNKPLQSWNVGDVTTLYQLRQSALYRCFTDVRASIQDFLFRDFSNLPSHHLLHPRRLPQHPVISFQKLPGKLSPNLADPCKIFFSNSLNVTPFSFIIELIIQTPYVFSGQLNNKINLYDWEGVLPLPIIFANDNYTLRKK